MRRPVILAALTALAVRALVITKLPAPPVWDGEIYARLAEHIASGHGYAQWSQSAPPWTPTAFYPVGYPAAIAAMILLCGKTALAAHLVNLVSGTIAAGCAAVLGHRVSGLRGGYLAGLAYALAPGPALWTVATMTETLTGALLAIAVTVSVVPVTATRARIRKAIGTGVALGLGALVRPQVILATPFVGGLAPATRRIRIVAAAVCVVSAVLVMLPWSLRNCATMGGCALVSTNGGSNLLIGTFPEARGGYREPTRSDGCANVRGEVARDRCMTRVALVRVTRNPLQWLRLGVIKVVKTFAWEWAPVSYLQSAIPGSFEGVYASRAAVICTAWWWAIVLAAIVGGTRAARIGGRVRALVQVVTLNVALFAITHAVFIGDDRYHLPLVALLAPLAAGVLLPSRPPVEPELVWAG